MSDRSVKLNLNRASGNRWLSPGLSLICVAAAAACGEAPEPVEKESLELRAEGDLRLAAVYTMTNDASANAVLAYYRGRDGALTPAGSFPTGGVGSGGGLGNQGALALSADGRILVVVNAGDDTVSSLRVSASELRLASRVASQGQRPISVALSGHQVYVLNAGSDSIAGFQVGRRGQLSALAGSVRPLSATGTGAAQIAFNPAGNVLVVTEKATNQITTYTVAGDGIPGEPVVQPSNGETPFGFAFDPQGFAIVSEAFGGAEGASALSSYEVGDDGQISVVRGSVGSGESAACWVAVSGGFAYTTNTRSGTISAYSVESYGDLTLVDPQAAVAAGPIDMAFNKNGRFLYVLSGGSHTIDIFKVRAGALTPIASTEAAPTANGMAAR